MMPGMNGLEALRRIRELHPSVKTLLMTGSNFDGELEQALRAGVIDAYLAKPWRFAEFESAIKRLTETMPQLRLPTDRPAALRGTSS
jgi:two-component system response regulator YesN